MSTLFAIQGFGTYATFEANEANLFHDLLRVSK